jgi:hypothetical protein
MTATTTPEEQSATQTGIVDRPHRRGRPQLIRLLENPRTSQGHVVTMLSAVSG